MPSCSRLPVLTKSRKSLRKVTVTAAGKKEAQVAAALIIEFYRNNIAPLQKSVEQTAPEKLRMHPVSCAFCAALFRDWSILRDAAEDGQVSSVDNKVFQEIDELTPWVFFNRNSSPEFAPHSTPLGSYLFKAGLDYPAIYKVIEKARKTPAGRPANRKAAVTALEMELDGKTRLEISEYLVQKGLIETPMSAYNDDHHRADHDLGSYRFKKLLPQAVRVGRAESVGFAALQRRSTQANW